MADTSAPISYTPQLRSIPIWLTSLIDIFILLYAVSIYILSFSEESNMISKLLALILMGLTAMYVLLVGRIKLNSLIGFCALFIFICLLSSFWAVNQNTALSMVSTLFQIFVLIFLLYNYLCFEDKMDYLIKVICIAGTVFAVYTVLYFGIDEYFAGLEEGARMGAEEINVNVVGMATASSAVIALWFVFYEKKLWYAVSVVVCAVVSLGSGSRKALIALILGVLFLFILKGNSRKKLLSILEGALLLVALYYVLQLPIFETIGERFESMLNAFTGEGSTDGSTNLRLNMIDVGLKQFEETPFTGVGIGNSKYITQKYLGWSTYLHNNYVELLASVGIFGTAAYYLMYIQPLFAVIKPAIKQNKYAVLALSLIFIELILQYGAVQYYSKTTYISLLLFSLIAERMKNRNVSEA